MFQIEGDRSLPAAFFNPEVAMGFIIEITHCTLTTEQQNNITVLLVGFSGLDDLEDVQGSLGSLDTWEKQ